MIEVSRADPSDWIRDMRPEATGCRDDTGLTVGRRFQPADMRPGVHYCAWLMAAWQLCAGLVWICWIVTGEVGVRSADGLVHAPRGISCWRGGREARVRRGHQ